MLRDDDHAASTLATFVLPVAKALRLLGEEPMEILESVGIDPSHVINPDRRIDVARMQKLWRQCVLVTGRPAFGLLAAEQVQPNTLQGLGLAFLASDTVHDALARLARFSRVISSGLALRLEEEGELTELIVDVPAVVLQQDFEFAAIDFGIGMIMKMCDLTLGEYVSPLHVQLQRPSPEDIDEFASLLGSRVSFDQADTRITFVTADISGRLINANPELARINDEQVETYLATFLDSSVVHLTAAAIVESLSQGVPGQGEIAAQLNMSGRTLQRKLKQEGSSFSTLLQDCRCELAQKYLSQPQRSVIEVAYQLGFSEPSTFSRAFKQWTGQSPAEYRAQP